MMGEDTTMTATDTQKTGDLTTEIGDTRPPTGAKTAVETGIPKMITGEGVAGVDIMTTRGGIMKITMSGAEGLLR